MMNKILNWMFVIISAAVFSGCHPGELRKARAYAMAEIEIEYLRQSSEWSKIKRKLKICLPTVERIDTLHGTDYAVQIPDALQKCAQGENAPVNQQTFAKGLQHVAVLAMRDEMTRITEPGNLAAKKTAAYFEGIRPTFIRRDENFFSSSSVLESGADDALQNLLAENTDSTTLQKSIGDLSDVINRTYALCVLFEFEDIAEKRGKDLKTCEKKLAEAEIFYRIIKNQVHSKSPEADSMISQMLSDGIEQIDPVTAKAALQTAFGPIL
jgi:hypothetical protein